MVYFSWKHPVDTETKVTWKIAQKYQEFDGTVGERTFQTDTVLYEYSQEKVGSKEPNSRLFSSKTKKNTKNSEIYQKNGKAQF